ncbi:glycerophosphoryl diester phosphodiesterase [Caulobacter ginsengisoli]|uniref:Glycerophosphoryl diester phosphodiesterase n=1 Tax=Caulobacter ginsengisoli TaxID=400775 RepID=A0ABU0IPS8_9CAUL|nr:glycerophosphodiester phosphodiesterase family protein [Caulobacter ginsengisoli]MDQ0464013.1 glycerophosphoryl diester phosphodiesterase [Caulobacter ginsengisoli]
MRRRTWALLIVGLAALGLYGLNASWLAPAPHGRPSLVAQRGLHQIYNSQPVGPSDCTAQRILPPTHRLIDNTLPSMAAAIAAGADVVELDVRRTADNAFVVFHDEGLDCRTQGHGLVSAHTVADLQTLDVGYGYTADGGRSFPLRGAGVGGMPTLAQTLAAFPRQRFLIQFKDGGPATADALAAYLAQAKITDWSRLTFFGGPVTLRRLQALHPGVRVMDQRAAAKCAVRYFALGWSGVTPKACRGIITIVSLDQSWLAWGWPNRYLARMRAAGSDVLVIGAVDNPKSGAFRRVNTPAQLERLPAGFDGMIWTDRIDLVGPAARKRWP